MLRSGEAKTTLEGSCETLFEIVSDYDQYQAWMPMIAHSKVLTREGDITIVEFRTSQGSDRSYTVELVHAAPTAITFQQIDSLDPAAVSGSWQLEASDTGVEVQAKLRVPTAFLRFGSRRRIRTELQVTLDALGTRSRQLNSSGPQTGATRRKVLEVVREARGLKIWYMGESYLVPKTRERERQ